MADQIKFSAIFIAYSSDQSKQVTLYNLNRAIVISKIVRSVANNDHANMFWTTDNKTFYYMSPQKTFGDYLPDWQPRSFVVDIDGLISQHNHDIVIHDMPTTIQNTDKSVRDYMNDIGDKIIEAVGNNQLPILYELVQSHQISPTDALKEVQSGIWIYEPDEEVDFNPVLTAVQWLVNNGAREGVTDKLIAYFLQYRQASVAEWLINYIVASDNDTYNKTSMAAVYKNNTRIIRTMITNGWNPLTNQQIPIAGIMNTAIKTGSINVFLTIAKAFPDLWILPYISVLDIWENAKKYQHVNILNIPNMGQKFMNILLMELAQKSNDDVDSIKIVLEQGANNYAEAINYASQYGNEKIVAELLAYPIKLNDLKVALHTAQASSFYNKQNIITLLHRAIAQITLSSNVSSQSSTSTSTYTSSAATSSASNTLIRSGPIKANNISFAKTRIDAGVYINSIKATGRFFSGYSVAPQIATKYALYVNVLDTDLFSKLSNSLPAYLSSSGTLTLYSGSNMLSFQAANGFAAIDTSLPIYNNAFLGQMQQIRHYLQNNNYSNSKADYALIWENIPENMRNVRDIIGTFLNVLEEN